MTHLSPNFPKKQSKINYTPYTLTDYERIKFDKYYVLGGLGPVNLGTEEWRAKKLALDRRNKYANRVNISNVRRLPLNYLREDLRESPYRRN